MQKFWVLLIMVCSKFDCSALTDPDEDTEYGCEALLPGLNITAPQDTDSPFSVSVNYTDGKITVTIESPAGEEFEGFFLEARSADDPTKLIEKGHFNYTQDAKSVHCYMEHDFTILTNANDKPKKRIVTKWSPEHGLEYDKILFRATVSKEGHNYWSESGPIQVIYVDPEQLGDPLFQKYVECFFTRGCHGLDEGCLQRSDCKILVTFIKTPMGLNLTMYGYLKDLDYMGVAISKDTKMGEVTVTECYREGNVVKVRESFNEGKMFQIKSSLLKNKYVSSLDADFASCSFNKPLTYMDMGRLYDLRKNRYRILLSTGTVAKEMIDHDTDRHAYSDEVDLLKFDSERIAAAATRKERETGNTAANLVP